MTKKIEDLIDVEKIGEDTYRLSIYFPEDKKQGVIETNVHSILNIFNNYLEENLERCLQLEEMIGNLGVVALTDSIGPLYFYIDKIFSTADIKGVYFKSLINTQVQEDDKIISKPIHFDTRIDNVTAPEEHKYFLSVLLETVCLNIIAADAETSNNEINFDLIMNLLLPVEIISNLNSFYLGEISKEEFSEYLQNETQETNDQLSKKEVILN